MKHESFSWSLAQTHHSHNKCMDYFMTFYHRVHISYRSNTENLLEVTGRYAF